MDSSVTETDFAPETKIDHELRLRALLRNGAEPLDYPRVEPQQFRIDKNFDPLEFYP